MKTKGYLLLEATVFFLIFSILALAILNMNLSSVLINQRISIKDYELDVCRSIIEFYKADGSELFTNITLKFDDFNAIKRDIVTSGFSNFINNTSKEKYKNGIYMLNIEFNRIEGLNSIKVTCINTNYNIKSSILYFK